MNTNDLLTLLQEYHFQVDELRRDYGRIRTMPATSFFLFGMGARRKLVYQAGVLKDGLSGEILRSWDVAFETIIPPAYTVLIEPHKAPPVTITENEIGIWLEEGDRVRSCGWLYSGQTARDRLEYGGYPGVPGWRRCLAVGRLYPIPIAQF